MPPRPNVASSLCIVSNAKQDLSHFYMQACYRLLGHNTPEMDPSSNCKVHAYRQFERVMRVPCQDVTKADFSANEEYITLYSVVHRRGIKVPDMVISVFDVQSGRKLRSLQVLLLIAFHCHLLLEIPTSSAFASAIAPAQVLL